jgi:DNA-directed RNA polymerase subunit F
MIIEKVPLTLAEVKNYLLDADHERPVYKYVKQFAPLSSEKASQACAEIRALNNPKLKEDNVTKLVDFLPRDAESVHKICNEAGLSEEECQKILGILINY